MALILFNKLPLQITTLTILQKLLMCSMIFFHEHRTKSSQGYPKRRTRVPYLFEKIRIPSPYSLTGSWSRNERYFFLILIQKNGSGCDRITNFLLKKLLNEIISLLTFILNLSMCTGLVPQKWKYLSLRLFQFSKKEKETLLMITDEFHFLHVFLNF